MIRLLFATAVTALAAVGPPKTPPPKVGGTQVAPPPAWADGSGRSLWMAFGSYCWSDKGKAACVDMIPPAGRTDIATLNAHRGARITIHLPFKPTSLRATLAGRTLHAVATMTTINWRARGGGLVIVGTKSSGGEASYMIRIRIAS